MQLPIKTLSIFISLIFTLGLRPIYSKDLCIAIFLSSSFSFSGSGTLLVIDATSCGEVPHVTKGSMSLPLIFTSLSNFASLSEYKVFQNANAFSQLPPVGDFGFPFR